MSPSRSSWLGITRRWRGNPTGAAAALLFFLTLIVYRLSPVAELTDSHYTMLFAQNLWQHHRLDAAPYFRPPLDPLQYPGSPTPRRPDPTLPYQTYRYAGGAYLWYPPGSFVLSGPFALLHSFFGVSAMGADQRYDARAERFIQRNTAAFLTAGTVTLLFLLAQCRLPTSASFMLALVAAFGTGLWSTASRVVWQHTWAGLLLSGALLLVTRAGLRNRPLHPILLGSLLAWLVMVRPPFALSAGAIWFFLLWRHPRDAWRIAAVGTFWLLGLVCFSVVTGGYPLPRYVVEASDMVSAAANRAVMGSLLSPSRGILVYSPVTVVLAWLLLRHGWGQRRSPLFVLGLAGTALHLALLAHTRCWYAGHSYGARYGTDLVPWLAFLAAMTMAPAAAAAPRRTLGRALGGSLLAGLILVSFHMQAWGAWVQESWAWNVRPADIDTDTRRVWDWRQPQFLSGLFTPEPMSPEVVPEARLGRRGTIRAGDDSADPFFFPGYGWSTANGIARWSASREPRAFFRVPEGTNLVLRMKVLPYLCSPSLTQQVVRVEWNHRRVADWTFAAPGFQVVTACLPATSRSVNELRLRIPHATAPLSLGQSDDPRALGLYIEWVRFD